MIKALLLDLGNVLVGFDFARGYRALAAVCPFPAEQIPARISQSGLVPPYERGEMSSQEFFERLSGVLRLEVSYAEFCQLWSTIFLREPLLSEAWLASLRRRYRMVLVSNTNDIHFRMIRENYPIVGHFDAHVLSYEVGAMKPAAPIYQEAIRQARCEPQECFYTDDVAEFVEAAQKLHLDAVQYSGPRALERELRSRGVEWE